MKQESKMASDNLIIEAFTGSHLYGTECPDSDIDLVGIFIPTKEYVLGVKRCDQVNLSNFENLVITDYTCYSLIKYIHLAIQNNPNIISLFYTPRNRIKYINIFGEDLIKNRNLFLSKKCYHTFRGYAHQQKRKMLLQNREGKRKDDVEKFGFDPKFAMHLMRLYYECLELMVAGEITYPSPNRVLLKQIREGEKSLEWIFGESERLETLIDEAYVKSDLQHSSDIKKIEELQISMLEMCWKVL